VIGYFNSPLFLWAWILGAFIALADGMIWSELGAAYPLAGGSYNFLRVAYGEKWGRMMSFLFVWQTSIQAPLVVASGAIGFAQYVEYLVPLGYYGQKLVPAGVIVLLTGCSTAAPRPSARFRCCCGSACWSPSPGSSSAGSRTGRFRTPSGRKTPAASGRAPSGWPSGRAA
jgi:amino acid transporter